MSTDFDTLFDRIERHESTQVKTDTFLAALEEATNWRHIRELCIFAHLIQVCPGVDEALLAKTKEIDKKNFGASGNSMLRSKEFLSGIIIGLDPATETFKWAIEERDGPQSAISNSASNSATQSRARA